MNMVEEIKLKDKENNILKKDTKNLLKMENSKFINMYYRAEGVFTFSLIALLLSIFLWDEVSDNLFFMLFSTIFNFLLMLFFLFKHMKLKGVL